VSRRRCGRSDHHDDEDRRSASRTAMLPVAAADLNGPLRVHAVAAAASAATGRSPAPGRRLRGRRSGPASGRGAPAPAQVDQHRGDGLPGRTEGRGPAAVEVVVVGGPGPAGAGGLGERQGHRRELAVARDPGGAAAPATRARGRHGEVGDAQTEHSVRRTATSTRAAAAPAGARTGRATRTARRPPPTATDPPAAVASRRTSSAPRSPPAGRRVGEVQGQLDRGRSHLAFSSATASTPSGRTGRSRWPRCGPTGPAQQVAGPRICSPQGDLEARASSCGPDGPQALVGRLGQHRRRWNR